MIYISRRPDWALWYFPTSFNGIQHILSFRCLLRNFPEVDRNSKNYIYYLNFMSKTSSQLITAFVETKQNMELDADKHRFT